MNAGQYDSDNVSPLRSGVPAVDAEFDALMRRFEQLGQPELDVLYDEAEQAQTHDLNAVMAPAVVRALPHPASGFGTSDADLIDAVRNDKIESYGKLYERHMRSANILAMQLSTLSADADDLVANAFASVLADLRAGGGPDAAFRLYLLQAVRHAADRSNKPKRLVLVGPAQDVDHAHAVTAFATLPERWQVALWHIAIEGETPGEIASLLGLTATGVSMMTARARKGLRKALLQAGEPSAVDGVLRGLVAPAVLGKGTAGYLAACASDSAAVRISASSGFRVAAAAVAAVVLTASGVISSGAPSYDPGVASRVTSSTAPPAGSSTVDHSATGLPPESAKLTGAAPGEISMAIGGPANELNISITNNGGSPTTLPTLTLTLPEEVETVGTGKTSVGVVGCPAGDRIVTCEGGQAVVPGQTYTFRARLQAGRKAGAGSITGTAGPVVVSILVTVAASHG